MTGDTEKRAIDGALALAVEAVGGVERVEPVTGGYSPDLKFVLWSGGEPRFLLRIALGENRERWAEQLHWIGVHHNNGVLCPAVHASGVVEPANAVYSVLDFLPGKTAAETLPGLPTAMQYEIGITAGRQLRRMHAVEGKEAPGSWRARLWGKYARYLGVMNDQGIGFEGQEAVEAYITRNARLLEARPVRFQHDDFHPDNLIVRDGRFAGVIDFNRFDWGDPWQDFYKVAMFTAPVSPSFARGQIAGYFDGKPPPGFWPLYNLYVAIATVSSVGWASLQRNQPVAFFRGKAADILSSHDFADGGPPAWYEPS